MRFSEEPVGSIRATVKPGVLAFQTRLCPKCNHGPKVVGECMPPPRRRRGKPISRSTQFKLTHRFKCRRCGQRVNRWAPGPVREIRQLEWREDDFYDSVVDGLKRP